MTKKQAHVVSKVVKRATCENTFTVVQKKKVLVKTMVRLEFIDGSILMMHFDATTNKLEGSQAYTGVGNGMD